MNRGEDAGRAMLPVRLSEWAGQVSERIAAVTNLPQVWPARRLPKTEGDPFGLLEHDDTYELLAEKVFESCEGIYNQLAQYNPDVRRQFERFARHPKKQPEITFPLSRMGPFKYKMSRDMRELSEGRTRYVFRRTDTRYVDRGFEVSKSGNGTVVLKLLGDTDPLADKEYYQLVCSAQKWVQDYAQEQSINVERLEEYAGQVPVPRSLGAAALQHSKACAGKIFTKKITGQRQIRVGRTIEVQHYTKVRPRALPLAVISAVGLSFVGNAIANHEAGVQAANEARQLRVRQAAQAAIVAYDRRGFQLPASSEVRVGSTASIPFVGNLDPDLQQAPLFPTDIRLGAVRHLSSLSIVYANGYEGLEAGSCEELTIKLAGLKGLKIVNADPASAHGLQATLSSSRLAICNTSHQDLSPETVQDIYLQPVAQ